MNLSVFARHNSYPVQVISQEGTNIRKMQSETQGLGVAFAMTTSIQLISYSAYV